MFRYLKYSLTTFVSGLLPSIVLAQDGSVQTPAGSSGLQNPISKVGSLQQLVGVILGVFAKVGAIFVVLAIIYAGFLFVTAQGNEEAIRKAKSVFFWTVIGAIVLLGAQAISNIIIETAGELGVEGLQS
ncbi:MAG TPA: hypothetical protein P5328_01145 [Candidatus Paceibacterota bacterium]|nr:hypothetical protein [Candidatus Paceibacterota bacterium]HRZ34592.1 hypothetical protein [Candidatus Paceibacterota bacterium]